MQYRVHITFMRDRGTEIKKKIFAVRKLAMMEHEASKCVIPQVCAKGCQESLSSTHLSGYHHHSSSILEKQHLPLYKICPRSSFEPMKQVRNSNLETRILDLKKKTRVPYCSSNPAHSPQNQTQKGIQVIGPDLGP